MPTTPQRRGPRPRVPFTPALADAICRRVQDGESIRAIGRDPDFPPHATIAKWRRVYPEFAAGMADAVAEAGVSRGGRPCRYTDDLAWAIVAGLEAGDTLAEICARPGMPHPSTVTNWFDLHPEFEALYALARQAQIEMIIDNVAELGRHVPRDGVAEAQARLRRLQVRYARIEGYWCRPRQRRIDAAARAEPSPPWIVHVTERVGD